MKTIVMKMWLVVAAALTVTLTSCSDNDDNNTSGKMTYLAEIEASDDVLSLATVNLQEYDNSGLLGAATQLTNTKYDWSKTITSYPAKVGLALSIEPKKQELTKEKYNITVVYKVIMKDAKGNMKGAEAGVSEKLSGVPAARVPGVLEKIKEALTNRKTLIDFTSASNFTQRSKSEFYYFNRLKR